MGPGNPDWIHPADSCPRVAGKGARSLCGHRPVDATLLATIAMPHKANLKLVIHASKAPRSSGPYASAVAAGNTLYISGQLGLVTETNQLVSDDVAEQTKVALTNIGHILEAVECTFKNVIKTTVRLLDINDFIKMNDEYGKICPDTARSVFFVKELVYGARVEVEAIALMGDLEQGLLTM